MKIPECLIYLAEVIHGPTGDVKANVSKIDPAMREGLLELNEIARTMGAEITSRQIVALFYYLWRRRIK